MKFYYQPLYQKQLQDLMVSQEIKLMFASPIPN